MNDLISRAAVKQAFNQYKKDKKVRTPFEANRIFDLFEIINGLPAVDAVPVVRCSECRWNDKGKNEVDSWDDCRLLRIGVYPTFYCANGERRNERAAD